MSTNKQNTNLQPAMFAVSNADGETPVYLYADPTTHGLVIGATNLNIRNLVFATDKVDASGTTLGANNGVDIGDVTINNAAGASAVNIQDGGNSITVDQATAASLNMTETSAASILTSVQLIDDIVGATGAAVPAKIAYIGGNDGTNSRGFLTTSTANLTGSSTQSVLMQAAFAEWNISSRPAAATKATVTKSAGAAGVRHVVTCFSFTIAAGATAQTPLQIDIIDGASGGATRLWSGTVACPANGMGVVAMNDTCFYGTAATQLTLEFSAAGVASSIQALTAWGYSTS